MFNKRNSRGKIRSIGELSEQVTAKMIGKFGFSSVKIIKEWPQIVGEEYAEIAQPIAVQFPPKQRLNGTLIIAVETGAALQIQHQAPIIIERINSYFGWAAVQHIRIRQK